MPTDTDRQLCRYSRSYSKKNVEKHTRSGITLGASKIRDFRTQQDGLNVTKLKQAHGIGDENVVKKDILCKTRMWPLEDSLGTVQ